jgi:hypothetical protein
MYRRRWASLGRMRRRFQDVAPREIGDDLSEALHQVDICGGQVHFGVENRPPVARDAHILRKNDTGVQFRERLTTFRGEVDESQAATPQAFLNTLVGNLSPKSVKNVWTTLRIMWNSAVAWKYVSGELHVELPKARKLRMRCYSVDEVKRLLANSKGAEQVFFWLGPGNWLHCVQAT